MFLFFLLCYCTAIINWNSTYFIKPTSYSQVSTTCKYVRVVAGDYCSLIGEQNGVSVSDIEKFNKGNYNWKGCKNLQIGYLLCVSDGLYPRPVSNPKAECGPYAPSTLFNAKCPLNACCSQYGFCGLTSEFCGDGCYSNCGSGILKGPSSSFSSIGYWMDNGHSLSNLDYDILHYAFVDINPDFSIDDSKYAKSGFNDIKSKRVVSFGGWEFSTNPSTYNIFRSGVTPANRDTLAKNIANFAVKYNLDGIDLDWEYPGAPDIPGIPADNRASGRNYLSFVKVLKSKLGSRTLSMAIPSSYWYLKNYPLKEISSYVDYFVFMTYDLYGVWDIDRDKAIKCHVNRTSIIDSIKMLTKADINISKVYGGVANYGRSYKASSSSCLRDGCHFSGPGNARELTNTPGVLAQSEIDSLNNVNEEWFDSVSQCDFIRYDGDSIVGYTKDVSSQVNFIKENGFRGSVLWATNYYNDYNYDELILETTDDFWENIEKEEAEYLGYYSDIGEMEAVKDQNCDKDPADIDINTEENDVCLYLRFTFDLIGAAYDALEYLSNIDRNEYEKDNKLYVENVQESLWSDFGRWTNLARLHDDKAITGDGSKFYNCIKDGKVKDSLYQCFQFKYCLNQVCEGNLPRPDRIAGLVLKDGVAEDAAKSLSEFVGMNIGAADFKRISKNGVPIYAGTKVDFKECDFVDFSLINKNPLDDITVEYLIDINDMLDKINREYKDYPIESYYSLTPMVAMMDIVETIKEVKEKAEEIRKAKHDQKILEIIGYIFMAVSIIAMPFGLVTNTAVGIASIVASTVAEYKLTGKVDGESLGLGLAGIVLPFIKSPTTKIGKLFESFDLNSLGKIKGKFKANSKYESIIKEKICQGR